VLDCAVIGVPDTEYGERLHAIVQPEPHAEIVPERLAAELRRVLAGFKVPRTFSVTDALPRDDNGKVAKRRLREQYAAAAR
jgi:long-chain acyl-CoA synthetase